MKNPSTFPKGVRIPDATQDIPTGNTKLVILDDDNIIDKYINLEDVGDKHFTYEQTSPSAIWLIDHPLNKKVSVTVTDSANTVVEGQITINDGVKVVITFNAPFTGTAILN